MKLAPDNLRTDYDIQPSLSETAGFRYTEQQMPLAIRNSIINYTKIQPTKGGILWFPFGNRKIDSKSN